MPVSRLFLLCLFALALPLISGCGNEAKKTKQAMTDAATKLVAAIETMAKEMIALQPLPNEGLQKTLTTFKKKANSINFTGCSDEFKDACTTLTQAIIAFLQSLSVFSNDMQRNEWEEGMREAFKFGTQLQDAEMRFRVLCQKLELGVQFKDEYWFGSRLNETPNTPPEPAER